MTKIIYIEGDLLASDERVIAHGCNAQGVMMSGIAKSIREMHPPAYDYYIEAYKLQGNRLYPGQVIIATDGYRKIINIVSQEFYGRDPDVVYVSYDGIMKAIRQISYLGYERVAFPKIGAGLANGDWTIISAIIERYSTFQPVVYTI